MCCGKDRMSQQSKSERSVQRKVCVLEVESKVPLRSLFLSPQMMDSNSGENKTKHSSCCHHNETGT